LTTQAVIAPQTKPAPSFLSNGNNDFDGDEPGNIDATAQDVQPLKQMILLDGNSRGCLHQPQAPRRKKIARAH
jgi:hypothetical protein